MSDLFRWLSENSAATAMVLVAFAISLPVLILIDIGGRLARPTSGNRAVQDRVEACYSSRHRVDWKVDYPKANQEFREGKPKGRRWEDIPVTFETAFQRPPQVVVSLRLRGCVVSTDGCDLKSRGRLRTKRPANDAGEK